MRVFIHRKDLRVTDLPGFDYMAEQGGPALHLLILDPAILKNNRHQAHSGVHFLAMVRRLLALYAGAGRQLHVVYGEPSAVVAALHAETPISELVFHEDVSPYAVHRDRALLRWADDAGVRLVALPDQRLVEPDDLERFAGRTEPYRVYTPYWNKWRAIMRDKAPAPYRVGIAQLETLGAPGGWLDAFEVPTWMWESLSEAQLHGVAVNPEAELQAFLGNRIEAYNDTRDDYAHPQTSNLSRYLNVGVLSPRTVWAMLPGTAGAEGWRRQLAWRDFYLYQAVRDPAFFRHEQKLEGAEALTDVHFKAWANGETGIPIIDAAMRELNATGYMHNRLRMVVAMFLTKNLLCPFQYGERYFRYQLTDYDNVLNRGGWLWSSSLGFDGAPYFRIMNPVSQSERWDPNGDYIRKWLPELAHLSKKEIHLPRPVAIVDLKASRAGAIDVYRDLLKSKE